MRSVTGAQETFEHYQKSTGFGAEARVAAALAKWGPNTFVVPLPKFADMLKEQLLAPFFVFQVFCVGLWCLDDYWCAPYSAFCPLNGCAFSPQDRKGLNECAACRYYSLFALLVMFKMSKLK